MKIELDREDILNEINDKYSNDADFYFYIIDNTTTIWEPIQELTRQLIAHLKAHDRMIDLEEEL